MATLGNLRKEKNKEVTREIFCDSVELNVTNIKLVETKTPTKYFPAISNKHFLQKLNNFLKTLNHQTSASSSSDICNFIGEKVVFFRAF